MSADHVEHVYMFRSNLSVLNDGSLDSWVNIDGHNNVPLREAIFQNSENFIPLSTFC